MPIETYAKKDNEWKHIKEIYIKKSNTWTPLKRKWVKQDNQWKLVFEKYDMGELQINIEPIDVIPLGAQWRIEE